MSKDTGQREGLVSTSQKVETFIRNAIYQGRLKPRERLIEDDIAKQLGCSRGPVREAVLRLERDGMIVITPRRGTFIRDISPDEVEVVFSVRGKLEGLCVRYMREDFTPEKKALVKKALEAMKSAAAAKDDERFLKADMRLHRTIWKLSGKQHLYRTLNYIMNPLFFMVAREYSSRLNSVEQSYRTHESYVQTILTVPIGRVEREVERYFSNLYKDLNKAVFHRSAPPLRNFDDDDEFSLDTEPGNVEIDA
ncbi:MAG TPA: GntR family transcriptional regulator [Bryobacteraceae bacterium]|nr:GntR family transcriptional regulator [Bryobacteraceae bacterium]